MGIQVISCIPTSLLSSAQAETLQWQSCHPEYVNGCKQKHMNAAQKKSPPNAVQRIREILKLNQLELSRLIGVSIFTVQSVETNRMRVSRRFAFRMAEETGVQAECFLTNQLGRELDPVRIRKQFQEAQKGAWRGIYKAQLLPLMIVLRLAYFQLKLAQKHGGYGACRNSGFLDQALKGNLKLLNSIKNSKERQEFHDAVREQMKGKNEVVLNYLSNIIQELRGNLKESQREQKLVVQQSVKGSNRKR